MKLIEKVSNYAFPFEWVNIKYYPQSIAEKKEIYLIEDDNTIEGLMLLFHSLFRNYKDHIFVYNNSWWDFCLDTWNPHTDEHDYSMHDKSDETRDYLELLQNSDIEIGYSGSCKCLNWDVFLSIVLKCVVSHQAPYSPIFYNKENNFFFYFHYSGSIGIYYHQHNEAIGEILNEANKEYDVQ